MTLSDPGLQVRQTVGKIVQRLQAAIDFPKKLKASEKVFAEESYGKNPNFIAPRKANSGKVIEGTHLDTLIEDYGDSSKVVTDAKSLGLRRSASIDGHMNDLKTQENRFKQLSITTAKDRSTPNHIQGGFRRVEQLRQNLKPESAAAQKK
jgi:hypothetical protein